VKHESDHIKMKSTDNGILKYLQFFSDNKMYFKQCGVIIIFTHDIITVSSVTNASISVLSQCPNFTDMKME